MFRYAFVFALASAIVVGIIVVTVIFYEDTAPAPRATDTPATVERSTDTLTSAPQITVRPDPAATSLPTRAVRPPTATTRPTRTPELPTATPAPTATSVPIPLPGGPANVRYIYHRDGRVVHSGFADFVRVSWEPVEGADYYKVYARAWMFDEQGPQCQLNKEGRPLNFCKLVISNLKETTYTFESPANLIRSGEEINRHWVAACNRGGCSGLVLAVPTATATPGIRATSAPAPAAGPRPSKPASVWAVREGATIRVGWEPVAGADYYKVYYDDFFPSGCTVGRDGRLHWCEELASGVTETSYVHTNPDGRTNYYWITACNSGGCSAIDSRNPAKFIDTSLNRPANVRYVREGATIRVSWAPVAGASYYKVYYDHFFDSGCTVEWGGEPAWCEELDSGVTETTYVHTNPDGRTNYYWITACSSRGCSTIDSKNPAAPQS